MRYQQNVSPQLAGGVIAKPSARCMTLAPGPDGVRREPPPSPRGHGRRCSQPGAGPPPCSAPGREWV